MKKRRYKFQIALLLCFTLSPSPWALSDNTPCTDNKQSPDVTSEVQKKNLEDIAQRTRIESLGESFWSLGMTCPDRVWPGLSYKTAAIVFSDPEKKQAFILNDPASPADQSSKLRQIPWSSEYAVTAYNFFQYREQPGMALNIHWEEGSKRRPDRTFEVGFHEAFHAFKQRTTQSTKKDSVKERRGMSVPINVEPLKYRHQFIRSLANALKETDKNKKNAILANVACLKKRFDQLENGKVRRHFLQTDRDEGTAEYTGTLANLFSEMNPDPCSVDPTKQNQEALAKFAKEFRFPPVIMPGDSQSYFLGDLAGFLLKERKFGWERTFDADKNKTPLDILLSDIIPSQDCSIDQETENAAREFKSMFETIENESLAISNKFNSHDFVKLAIPARLRQGAMTLVGGFTFTDSLPANGTINLGLIDYKVDQEELKLRLTGSAINQESTPCGNERAMIIMVPKSDVQVKEGVFTLKPGSDLLKPVSQGPSSPPPGPPKITLPSDSLKFEVAPKITQKKAERGGDYFCISSN